MTLRFTICCCLFLTSLSGVQAQIFPGDADNNGRVEHYDILNIGLAFGNFGPSRVSTPGTNVEDLALAWSRSFPSGLNYAYADANGDGLVDFRDFQTVFLNYALEWKPVEEVHIPVETDADDPRLAFANADSLFLVQRQSLTLSLRLGHPGQRIDSLNGLAFRIRYDPDYFSEFNYDARGNWLSANAGEAFTFQHTRPGEIEVAITRFGRRPLNGSGEFGEVALIVVGDLIGLMPANRDTATTVIRIEDILAITHNADTIAVKPTELPIQLRQADALPSNTIEADENQLVIAPNPCFGELWARSETAFHRLEWSDALGRSRLLYQGPALRQWSGRLPPGPVGYYCLKVIGTDYVHTRQVLVLDP